MFSRTLLFVGFYVCYLMFVFIVYTNEKNCDVLVCSLLPITYSIGTALIPPRHCYCAAAAVCIHLRYFSVYLIRPIPWQFDFVLHHWNFFFHSLRFEYEIFNGERKLAHTEKKVQFKLQTTKVCSVSFGNRLTIESKIFDQYLFKLIGKCNNE